MTEELYYSIKEACVISGIPKKHLENYIKFGQELTMVKIRVRNYLDKAEFDKYISDRNDRMILLDRNDYIQCLEFAIKSYYSYKSTSDFGTTQQRDAGKFIFNFVQGKLGEIAVKKMLKNVFDVDISLDFSLREAVVGQDITEIAKPRKGGRVLNPLNLRVAIKSTKMKNYWLIVSQKEVEDTERNSDIYILTRVDLSLDHLISILKEHEALKNLNSIIPSYEDVKAEVCGFVRKSELMENKPVAELPDSGQEIQPSYIKNSGHVIKSRNEWKSLIDEL